MRYVASDKHNILSHANKGYCKQDFTRRQWHRQFNKNTVKPVNKVRWHNIRQYWVMQHEKDLQSACGCTTDKWQNPLHLTWCLSMKTKMSRKNPPKHFLFPHKFVGRWTQNFLIANHINLVTYPSQSVWIQLKNANRSWRQICREFLEKILEEVLPFNRSLYSCSSRGSWPQQKHLLAILISCSILTAFKLHTSVSCWLVSKFRHSDFQSVILTRVTPK